VQYFNIENGPVQICTGLFIFMKLDVLTIDGYIKHPSCFAKTHQYPIGYNSFGLRENEPERV